MVSKMKLVLKLILLFLIYNESTGEIQKIKFFFEPYNYGDPNACPTETTYPVAEFSSLKIPDLQSLIDGEISDIGTFHTVGIWATYASPNYSLVGGGTLGGYAACTAYEDPSRNPKSMRFLGNPDAALPGLSLFNGSWPIGEEMYVDGSDGAMVFEPRLCIGFWAVTGNQNWTLYTNQNFTGDSLCVRPNPDGIEWGTFDPSAIGSVRVGCDDSPILEGYIGSTYGESAEGQEFQVTYDQFHSDYVPQHGGLKMEPCV